MNVRSHFNRVTHNASFDISFCLSLPHSKALKPVYSKRIGLLSLMSTTNQVRALNGRHEKPVRGIEDSPAVIEFLATRRVRFFLILPALVFYSYFFLLVTWHGATIICPTALAPELHLLQRDISAPEATETRNQMSTSSKTQKKRRTIYDIYHFSKNEGVSRITDDIETTSVHLNMDKNYCAVFTRKLRHFIPVYFVQREEMIAAKLLAANGKGKELNHETLHNLLKHHPIKRAMLIAATFFHRKSSKKGPPQAKEIPKSIVLSPSLMTTNQRGLVKELGIRVRKLANDPLFDSRLSEVPWGGPAGKDNLQYRYWWSPVGKSGEFDDGFYVLASYLIIMQWPADLVQKFPGRLCPNGCPCETALLHTVEYREKFKPWLVPPLLIKEGRDGWIYHRGFSRDRHSMVWFRPGYHVQENVEGYVRSILYALERAVSDALVNSQGTVGKYNIVVDCHRFSLSGIPKINHVKKMFTFLQDHFPNRCGVIFIANLAGPAQLFLKMIRPLLHEVCSLLIFSTLLLLFRLKLNSFLFSCSGRQEKNSNNSQRDSRT